MDQSHIDEYTIDALVLRMEESRIPRAMRMLERVNSGEILSDSDIFFLNRVNDENLANQHLAEDHRDYGRLVAGFIDLCSEIITKGLENEKAR